MKNKTSNCKKIVLVTGGTGFIGQRLVKRMLSNGYKVRLLSRSRVSRTDNTDDQLEYIEGDIASEHDVNNACKGVDVVYHLAAAMQGSWGDHQRITIDGTKNINDACNKNKVKQLIYISTLNVYDASSYKKNITISEGFPYENNPLMRGNYSHAKLMAEKYLIEYPPKGLSISIIRPGLVYGNPERPFPLDVGKKLFNKLFIIPGMGNKKIPFVYVENLIDAILNVDLGKIDINSEIKIYNVVDKDPITARQYLKEYSTISNHFFFKIYIPFFLILSAGKVVDTLNSFRNKKSYNYYKVKLLMNESLYSTEHIQKDLGWSQRFNFKRAMLDFLVSEKNSSE